MSSREILNIVYNDLAGAYEGGKAGAWAGGKVGTFLGNPITGAAFGAFIGGVGFGAFRSWLAWPTTANSPSQNMPIDLENVEYSAIADAYSKFCLGDENFIKELEVKIQLDSSIIKNVNLDNDALMVGEKHNIMLAGLHGTISAPNRITTKISIPDDGLEKDKTLEYSILYSPEMEEAFDGFYSNLKQTTEINGVNLPDNIIKLYSDLILNYVSECDDIIFIINKYSECINSSSELSDDEKSYLNMGLATSLYSYNYWNNTDLQ